MTSNANNTADEQRNTTPMQPLFDKLREDLRYKFKSYGATGTIDRAELTPPKMTLDQMRASIVQISGKEPCYVFRDNPYIVRSEISMRSKLKGNWTKKMVKTKGGEDKEKFVPAFDEWLSDGVGRIQVDTVTFDPNFGEFCLDHNEKGRAPAINLWRPFPVNVPPADWPARVQPFLDHVAYLFPIAVERERFLDWFAHIAQYPGQRPSFHYLLITPKQGTGRGWMDCLMARLFPGYVALDFDLPEYLQQGWNGELGHKLIATVNEIREGGRADSQRAYQKLKRIANAPTRKINEKFELRRWELNCVRWFIESNHEDAIPLDENDRRFEVVRNPDTAHQGGEAYYTYIYKQIDFDNPDSELFVSSVREWMLRRDLSKFNAHAPVVANAIKREVVAANLSEHQLNAQEVVNTWPFNVIETSQLSRLVFGIQAEVVGFSNNARLAGIARDAKIRKYPHDVVIDRKRVPVWILRKYELCVEISVEMMKAEIQRQRTSSSAAGAAGAVGYS